MTTGFRLRDFRTLGPMHVYACQAGFAPFTALSEREQADVEAHAHDIVDVRAVWWKRVRSEGGWVWEPLKVREGNA